MFGSSYKSILKYLTTHTSINNRVPVHKLNFTSSNCLGKLIHCRGSLKRTRARYSCQVSNTLNTINRRLQIDTSRSKRTNITSHLGKVVDGLISIGIQRVKCFVDLTDVGMLFLSIGQNCLNRVHLKLILMQTIDNRLNGYSFSYVCSSC